MKIGWVFIVAGFLASSSVWAGVTSPVTPPFSVHKVNKLTNTVDSLNEAGDKIVSNKVKKDAIGEIICGRALGNKEEVVAVIPCPVDRVIDEDLVLAVYSTDTDIEPADCVAGRINVDVDDAIAAIDNGRTTAVSALADIAIAGQGTQSVLDWIAGIQVQTKEYNKGPMKGFDCAKSVKSKAGTGLLLGDPITRVQLEIGKVQGGVTQ